MSLQVIIWGAGRELGIIAIDCERRGEVYFCRMLEHIEDPLCLELQALGPEETELSLEEMLNEVKYFEVEQEVCLNEKNGD